MATFLPHGVYAAALTPLRADGSLDLDNVVPYLDFLARRGCHGALLFGTTGEGPSFAPEERAELVRVALQIRQAHPQFGLLLGTGTPSLSETITLTRSAFELGMDGVVVLPPYFNRKVSDDGLFTWFSEVIRKAVPADGCFLGYHIPQMTGIQFSLSLLDRLKRAFPGQFAGIKNSWVEEPYAAALGDRFGSDMVVMTGFDNYFQLSLSKGAAGCITASATLISPLLRKLYDASQKGEDPSPYQAEVNRIRAVMDSCPPAPPLVKGLLARWHGFPRWAVCPPLVATSDEGLDQVEQGMKAM